MVAGTLVQEERSISGPIQGLSTEPLYLDVHLPGGASFRAPITAGHHAFLYLYDGAASVGEDHQALPHRAAGILSDGDTIRVQAGPEGTRFLLLAGKPLREPIVQHGPFVMNTREEIDRALADYRDGTLAAPERAA